MDKLDAKALSEAAARLEGWAVDPAALRRTIRFPGAYAQVIAFVDRAAALAQAADHHPDLAVHYDTVEITLSSHDAGGVTAKDTAMAEALDRAFAHVTAESPAPAYDPKAKERALRAITYGLVIVGSRAGDELNGMTANWLTQLSFEPALVGVSVENDAHTCDLIHRGGAFSVNVVPDGREDLVERFVKPQRRVENKLGDVPFHEGAATGTPILDEAVAAFECRVVGVHTTGDHTLFVGQVVGAAIPSEGNPLTLQALGWHYGG